MVTSTCIHLDDDIRAERQNLAPEGIEPSVEISIIFDKHEVNYFMRPDKVDQFVDAICTAAYGTSYSELAQSYKEAEDECQDKDAFIEKLEIEVDKLNENIDYMKMMKPNEADQHELY